MPSTKQIWTNLQEETLLFGRGCVHERPLGHWSVVFFSGVKIRHVEAHRPAVAHQLQMSGAWRHCCHEDLPIKSRLNILFGKSFASFATITEIALLFNKLRKGI